MAEKSIHLGTLLKLQSALEMFDMSFSTSNKLFRLALVSEMIDTAGLFEQLAEDWKDNLPYGEGPDLDVDFEYWSEYNAWENLHMRATQNECIEGFPISLGNGRTSENAKRFKKSTYTKYLSSIFKSTRYEGKDTATDFLKFLMDDKTGTTRFGNIVSYALFHLTSAIRKANAVLQSPSDASLSRYYDAQLMRSESYIKEELHKVRDILNDTTISEKRKENSLRAQRDIISENLRKSSFLMELKNAFNRYDIDDFRKDKTEYHNLSDDQVLEKLALSDLFDSNGEPHKIKIARHIFNHRKELSKESIASFFLYTIVLPEIDKHLPHYATIHTLEEHKSVLTSNNGEHPKVFISYSWDDKEHEEWVLKLASDLRSKYGIDATLDKWEIGFGKLLPNFMEHAITDSERVICVMTPNYKKKTVELQGGVGVEYAVMSAEIQKNIKTGKFIPLFRNGSIEDIPTFLAGRDYIDMRDDSKYDEAIEELVRDIFDKPKYKKPELGAIPKLD